MKYIDYNAVLAEQDKERELIMKKAAMQTEIKELESKQAAEMKALAEKHGYKTFGELQNWLYPSALPKRSGIAVHVKKMAAKGKKPRKQRVKVTPEMKAKIADMKKAGTKVADIAKELNLSPFTVNKY